MTGAEPHRLEEVLGQICGFDINVTTIHPEMPYSVVIFLKAQSRIVPTVVPKKSKCELSILAYVQDNLILLP